MVKKINLFGNLILLIFLIFSCSDKNINKGYEGNTLNYEIDFPSTVYTNKVYKGKITFYNKFLDSIAEPRRDTTNFRFITYKPYKPYPYKDDFNPIYGDSILLDKNTVDIELKFDKPGIYNIGGFVRDGMMIGYYSNGVRDSVRFIEHEIIILQKVTVKDSI